MSKDKCPPELLQLAEDVGNFIHYWGFKKVHGRMWALMAVMERPLDAAFFQEHLGISKALVSMSIKDLLRYNVIEKAGESERGTMGYSINPDLESVILGVLRSREQILIARAGTSLNILKRLSAARKAQAGIADKKIESVAELLGGAEQFLDGLLSGAMFKA